MMLNFFLCVCVWSFFIIFLKKKKVFEICTQDDRRVFSCLLFQNKFEKRVLQDALSAVE